MALEYTDRSFELWRNLVFHKFEAGGFTDGKPDFAVRAHRHFPLGAIDQIRELDAGTAREKLEGNRLGGFRVSDLTKEGQVPASLRPRLDNTTILDRYF